MTTNFFRAVFFSYSTLILQKKVKISFSFYLNFKEAYIVAPARNMIYKYILVIPQKKYRFVQFKSAMCFRVTAAIGIGNGLRFQCMEL